MLLMTKAQRSKLEKNGHEQQEATLRGRSLDFHPVVKLFTPWGGCTWLLSEICPVDQAGQVDQACPVDQADHGNQVIAFGLCDLGMGSPELGYVDLSEVANIRGPFGLRVERDMYFSPEKPISAYAREAEKAGRIVS